jgi:hypothetical protein
MSDELSLVWHDTWLRMWYSEDSGQERNPGRTGCMLGNGVYLASLKGRAAKVEGISAEVRAGKDKVWWIAGTRITLVGSSDAHDSAV